MSLPINAMEMADTSAGILATNSTLFEMLPDGAELDMAVCAGVAPRRAASYPESLLGAAVLTAAACADETDSTIASAPARGSPRPSQGAALPAPIPAVCYAADSRTTSSTGSDAEIGPLHVL